MSSLFNRRSTCSNTSTELESFNTAEFKMLSERIAYNIVSVKFNWQKLEKAFKIIGTAKDTLSYREDVHQIQLTTNGQIQTTNVDLQRLTDVVKSNKDKRRQLLVEKMTSDFKKVVQMYSSSQKRIAAKMKEIILKRLSQNIGTDRVSSSGNEMAPTQKQQMSDENLQFEEIMLLDNEMCLRKIEEDVLDVNKIMIDLSAMVHRQAEQISKFEQDIIDVEKKTEDGTSKLAEAAESRARYRCKCTVLLVIAVIIIFVIVTGVIVMIVT